jgi:mannose-6-phosphate isomerase-like protein (cupin superfamily)
MEIERIERGGQILAIIIRAGASESGVRFFTPPEFSQQLGYMQHPAGKKIQPHIHIEVRRKVDMTQEVLVLRRGRLRVDFYTTGQVYLESRELRAGDVILLASAGHGFEVLEDVEMFEIKQGPYAESKDKIRFEGTMPGNSGMRSDRDGQ